MKTLKDPYDLPSSDIRKLVEKENEIEINPGEISSFFEELKFELFEQERLKEYLEEREAAMWRAFLSRDYELAFKDAKEIKDIMPEYRKKEVGGCIKECAENGNKTALIYVVDSILKINNGMVSAEMFPYLKKLAVYGYIPSFRYLADCYAYELGCKKDMGIADKLYFEGALFANDPYCKDVYHNLHPSNVSDPNDNIEKKVINRILSSDKWYEEEARTMYAEFILDGKLPDYGPGDAYALLKSIDYGGDCFCQYRLGDCMLNGIGTKPSANIAYDLLDDACFNFRWVIENGYKRFLEFNEYSLRTEYEFINSYERAKTLLESADLCYKYEDECVVSLHYDPGTNEGTYYSEWEEMKKYYDWWLDYKPLYIDPNTNKWLEEIGG